jgi:hypothetical protein
VLQLHVILVQVYLVVVLLLATLVRECPVALLLPVTLAKE